MWSGPWLFCLYLGSQIKVNEYPVQWVTAVLFLWCAAVYCVANVLQTMIYSCIFGTVTMFIPVFHQLFKSYLQIRIYIFAHIFCIVSLCKHWDDNDIMLITWCSHFVHCLQMKWIMLVILSSDVTLMILSVPVVVQFLLEVFVISMCLCEGIFGTLIYFIFHDDGSVLFSWWTESYLSDVWILYVLSGWHLYVHIP